MPLPLSLTRVGLLRRLPFGAWLADTTSPPAVRTLPYASAVCSVSTAVVPQVTPCKSAGKHAFAPLLCSWAVSFGAVWLAGRDPAAQLSH